MLLIRMQRVDSAFDCAQRQAAPIAITIMAVKMRRPRFGQSGMQIGLEPLRIEIEWKAQVGAMRRIGIHHATILAGVREFGLPSWAPVSILNGRNGVPAPFNALIVSTLPCEFPSRRHGL